MNEWHFRPRFCAVRLYWASDNLKAEMNFGINHSPGAVHQLTCSPAFYHCAMIAPLRKQQQPIQMLVFSVIEYVLIVLYLNQRCNWTIWSQFQTLYFYSTNWTTGVMILLG